MNTVSEERVTPRSPLSKGERSIFLWQMVTKPEEFKAAIRAWQRDGSFGGLARTLYLGNPQEPATANYVDFSHYTKDELEGISFDGIVFAHATFPNSAYIRFLENAGARLKDCSVVRNGNVESTTTDYTIPDAWLKETPSPRSHAELVRESQFYERVAKQR